MIRDLPLVDYEQKLAIACMRMEATGLMVDVEYAEGFLTDHLNTQETLAKAICKGGGIANVNSSKQVTDALQAHGAELTKTTKTGKLSADSEVLDAIIANQDGPGAKLAKAVKDAKQAGSYKVKYVDSVLSSLDPNDRVHPSITALQARTARMAVSEPPFHQLPSDDYLLRRMIRAREGHVIIAIDFQQIELRVLAALANEKRMLRAFAEGEDLHQVTADAANVARSVGKTTNFLIVYGGGAGKLAISAGVNMSTAKRVIQAFKRTYPGVNRLNKRITEEFHAGRRYVRTPTGRVLPIDRQRVYGGLNYLIQSTARDVLGQAMVNLAAGPYWDCALLPIHDELLLEVPADMVEEVTAAFEEAMNIYNFMDRGIDILTDTSEPAPSWGHLYLKDGEEMPA